MIGRGARLGWRVPRGRRHAHTFRDRRSHMSELPRDSRLGGESGVVEVAPVPEEAPASLGKALRQIGPGLILAGAIVGTGELIATTNLGAKAGFALLWLVLLSCFIKVFAQVELGRYAISSGDTTFLAFTRLPGAGILLVWWCVGMVVVTQFQIGAMIAGIAQAIQMVGSAGSTSQGARLAEWPWALVVTAVTIMMLSTGSYRLVERVSVVLVAGFTIMTVVCLAFLPGDHAVTAGDVMSGLKFEIPPGAVMAAFTMFGITGVGASELLTYPYWCLEKGYGRHVGPREETEGWARRARGWMRVMRLDAWVSMLVYTIATLAFFLLGASVLHKTTGGKGLPETGMISALAEMYTPSLGRERAKWFIMLGAFCVLYSTLFAATAGNSRLLADGVRIALGPQRVSEHMRRSLVRVFCVVLPLFGFSLYLILADPVAMVTVGGLMQGLSLPFIAAAAVYLRYKRTDKRITPGLLWDVGLWLSLLGLAGAATYSLWSGVGKLGALVASPA